MEKKLSFPIGEYTELFWIRLKTTWINMIEYFRIVGHYYIQSLSFMQLDSYLIGSYFFNSPFSISKRFLEKRGDENVYAYGETPLTTLEKIVNECRITAKDTVFELGCGRGRSCFWLAHFIKCNVVGIEYIPEFIKRANKVKNKFDIKNVEFRHEDMIKTDLSGATVVYLYGTCLDEEVIQKLAQKMAKLPSGTKVITVSYPLSEYCASTRQDFEVMKRFPAKFTWGTTDVYLQIRK